MNTAARRALILLVLLIAGVTLTLVAAGCDPYAGCARQNCPSDPQDHTKEAFGCAVVAVIRPVC